MDEEPASEPLAGADRHRRQPALAKQPVAILPDQLINRRDHRGRLGRRGALGAQVLMQRPDARTRQPPAIAPIVGEEGAHRRGAELIELQGLALIQRARCPSAISDRITTDGE
jgi:hypothetical protein